MNNMKEWVPDAGDRFEVYDELSCDWDSGTCLAHGDLMMLAVINGREQCVNLGSKFRPIKTEAERQMDELIKIIKNNSDLTAGFLTDCITVTGYIKPRELNSLAISKLIDRHAKMFRHTLNMTDFAVLVGQYVRGEITLD